MNDLLQFKGQKVSSAFSHLDPTQSLGEGVAGGFPVINFRGKMWSLRLRGEKYAFVRDDDGTPLSYLDVIIVGVSPGMSKLFYPPGTWDEDSAGAPICASVGGIVPDPGVPEPQSPSCGICRHNQWANQPNGRRGKACQDHKRLAVLLMPSITTKMLGAPLTEPAFLKVPPGSLMTLKAYGDSLTHQGYHYAAVVTRISFAPDKLFQMTFKGLQVLTDKEAPLVLPLLEDPMTKRIIGLAPAVREIAPSRIENVKPIDTGLAAAFGNGQQGATRTGYAERVAQNQPHIPDENIIEPEPVKRGRGRPPKNPAVAQVTQQVLAREPAPGAGSEPDVTMPWSEGNTELDKEVADLLNKKVDDMLK